MKKFLWLVGLVSLFALGQIIAPLSQAQTASDDNVTDAMTIIKGDGEVALPTAVLGTGAGYTYAAVTGGVAGFDAGNARIVEELNKNKLATSINLDTITLTTLKLGTGVYSFDVTGSKKTIRVTYFLTPSNIATRADLLP